MKRLKAMSNREWVQRHKPEKMNEDCVGGVKGCPLDYSLEKEAENHNCCADCWDLPAKRKGKYIMKVVAE